MTVALAGRAPATFELKSGQLPLLVLLLKTADLALLRAEFEQRYAEHPDFFDQDAVLDDLGAIAGSAEVPDFAALRTLLPSWRLQPVAVRGGSAQQRAAALAAGLAAGDDARIAGAPTQPDPGPGSEPDESAPAPAAAPAVTAAEHVPMVLPQALVIDKPLRSGQQVYARGRDLVVMAMVNPGAEVIADGHIHVYAPLRGKAIAGARGNADARIFSLSLQAELLSIAGTYRTSELPLPDVVRGHPAQVRLDGDKLVMDVLGA